MEPLATIRTVSHVAIEVRDLAASVAFYKRTLGMRIAGDFSGDPIQPNIKGMLGDFAIEIAQLPDTPERDHVAARRALLPAVWLSLNVADARGAFERCKQAGLTSLDAPSMQNDVYFFSFRDLDEFLIEIIEFPEGMTSLGEYLVWHEKNATGEVHV